MVINHRPSIMVITETRVGGDRAGRIIEGLIFDGFITTDTIGYTGGLWLLWKKEDINVNLLASTEQEYMPPSRYVPRINLGLFQLFMSVLD